MARTILNRYLHGEPVSKIAEDLGVSRETVYKRLRNDPMWNVYKRVHYCFKNKEIIKLIYEGLTLTEIAKKLRLSLPTVSIRVKKLLKYGCIHEDFIKNKRGLGKTTKRIMALVKQGVPIDEIAQRIGKDTKWVRVYVYRLVKYGLLTQEEAKKVSKITFKSK